MWNSLPNDMEKVTEFAEFRRQIRTWTARAAELPSVAVREVSQHVSWLTVIFSFLVGSHVILKFAVYLKYFFFAAGSAF